MTIAGKPMILHVCERASEAQAEEVVVATDDHRIYKTVIEAGVKAVMTRKDHENGTVRIAEVVEACAWEATDIVVNLQGDEPLIPASTIHDLATGLAGQTVAQVATLAAPISGATELFDSNIVKVVSDQYGFALYFSRAPIPWDRDRFGGEPITGELGSCYMRHIGMYAYRVEFLGHYVDWKPCRLEVVESLEQLRILWYGEKIKVIELNQAPEPGVDTRDDLKRVQSRIKHCLRAH